MKKARIMLVAIATLGIVGGAVAFKSNYNALIYTSTNANCTNTVHGVTITNAGTARIFATTTPGACSLQFTKALQ